MCLVERPSPRSASSVEECVCASEHVEADKRVRLNDMLVVWRSQREQTNSLCQLVCVCAGMRPTETGQIDYARE